MNDEALKIKGFDSFFFCRNDSLRVQKIKALSCQFLLELLQPGSLHFHPLYNSTSGKVSTGLSLPLLM